MRKSKPLHLFTPERLHRDREMTKGEIARFLHEFQALLQGDEGKRKLISLRVPDKLLSQFRKKAERVGVAYQTQIVRLMREWMREPLRRRSAGVRLCVAGKLLRRS